MAAAEAAASKKATDIRILEVAEVLGVADYFVLASAASERRLDTAVEAIEEGCAAHGYRPLSREGTTEGGWRLLDFGDVVVHAFTEQQRAFYALERLWADAPTVPFEAPAEAGARE